MDAKKIRIVYMGTPDFAVEPLRRLVEGGYNVVGVVTVADKPSGRGLTINQSAVKKYAVEHGIPVFQPLKLKDPQWLEELSALDLDLGIVVAFRMLPEVVWDMPRLGTFNLHGSLLPKYRGAAPINWAIMNGDSESGVTTFFLDHEIDCGKIIDQRSVEISETDTAGDLHDKLMYLGGDLVIETVEKIARGDAHTKPQDESLVCQAPKIFKNDCLINFASTGKQIKDMVRGLSPYPAAWTDVLDVTAKVFDVDFVPFGADEPRITPRHVDSDSKTFLRVSCEDGWIYIKTIQLAGKKSMNISDLLRGYKPKLLKA